MLWAAFTIHCNVYIGLAFKMCAFLLERHTLCRHEPGVARMRESLRSPLSLHTLMEDNGCSEMLTCNRSTYSMCSQGMACIAGQQRKGKTGIWVRCRVAGIWHSRRAAATEGNKGQAMGVKPLPATATAIQCKGGCCLAQHQCRCTCSRCITTLMLTTHQP